MKNLKETFAGFHYLFLRALLPFIPVFGVLCALNFFSSAKILGVVGATSLSSSSCSVAAIPKADINTPRHLFGAYITACIIGVCGYYVSFYVSDILPQVLTMEYRALAGAVSVCLCFFIMLLFRLVHFTAAGFCLALVIEPWDTRTIAIVASFLIVLAFMRQFLCYRVEDLT